MKRPLQPFLHVCRTPPKHAVFEIRPGWYFSIKTGLAYVALIAFSLGCWTLIYFAVGWYFSLLGGHHG